MNRCRGTRGFTLIEMLVVVVVILVLSGIILRTTVLVLRRAGNAKALYEIEQLKNALNEYYAEYGNYPPTDFMAYEYEGERTRANPSFRMFLQNPLYNDPADTNRFFADMHRSGGWPPSDPAKNLFCRYGLVAYLYTRARGQTHWYDSDTPRDLAAKAKWAHFLDDVPLSGGEAGHVVNLASVIHFTNSVDTVLDPWERDYRYVSKPPYLSYRLWSAGPDGVDGTADDISGDSDM